MFHLLFVLDVVLVILVRVAERLVRCELLLDHPLQHSVVRELLLHVEQLLPDLPLVVGLGKLIDPCLVELSFFLLGKLFLVGLPFFLFEFLTLLVNSLLDDCETVLWAGLFLWREVNQVHLALILADFSIVKLERLTLFRP